MVSKYTIINWFLFPLPKLYIVINAWTECHGTYNICYSVK